nr:complement C1r subcomponent-like [Leptinotarsa decemlineata]
MAKKQYLCFFIWIVYSSVVAQVGDKCTVGHSNQVGDCKIISHCPQAEEEAKIGIDPTLCGFFELTTPIVCCGVNSNPQPNELMPESSIPNSQPSSDKSQVNELSRPDFVFPDHHSSSHISSNGFTGLSEAKCEEYSKGVTSVVQVLPLVTYPNPINFTVPKCDYNSVPLIVGGQPASAGEFPFMAAIGFNTTDQPWRCGGTLISERYVLTAAHCTFTSDAGPPSVVRLGELDLSTDKDGSEHRDYAVSKVVLHPEYEYPWKYNDIALLKTYSKVIFTKFIRPACLYTRTDIEYNTGVATGWGRTDFAGENSDRLMAVTLNIFENERCYRTYQSNKDLPKGITSSMLCAGELKGGKDTCQGDSGGPLLITKEGNQCKFYIVGITSFGKSCGQVNTPAIYTRVSEYIPWIEQNIWFGDKCTLKHNNQEGYCKIISHCPLVQEEAKTGSDPTLCGFFELTTPIVCCGFKSNPQPKGSKSSISKYHPSEISSRSHGKYYQHPSLDMNSRGNISISETKCEEYTKEVISSVLVIPLVPNPIPVNAISPKCKYNNIRLIVGGQPASPGEFPFMAAIGFNTTDQPWRCGGTLISDRYVLTAAHCTFTTDAGPPSVVRLGVLDLSINRNRSEHMDYTISKVVLHPEYKYSMKYNDIALLKTYSKVIFTKFIRPVCLYTKSIIDYPTGVATGWGKTEFAGDNSNKLMAVTLDIYPNERCSKIAEVDSDQLPNGITSNMLCAGDIRGGSDTCTGDSGGPLLITKNGNQCKFYIVGITSFGISCGVVNTSGIYTRVSEYISWIEQNIW